MAAVIRRSMLEACYFVVLALLRNGKDNEGDKKNHRFWVREVFQKREELGSYHALVQELRLQVFVFVIFGNFVVQTVKTLNLFHERSHFAHAFVAILEKNV